jgi:hypothetical protein
VLALDRWGMCLFGRHHPLWQIAVGHGTHARRRGCSLQAVVSCAREIALGILVA